MFQIKENVKMRILFTYWLKRSAVFQLKPYVQKTNKGEKLLS